MRSVRSWRIVTTAVAATLFLFGAGCGDDDSSDDRGIFDAGGDTGMEDAGSQDGGDAGSDTGQFACQFFPDDCDDGENCFPTMQGRQCAPFVEGKAAGESCSDLNDCGEGQLCTQEEICRTRCDPDASSSENACDDAAACAPLGDGQGGTRPIGICQPECEQFPNDSCPEGENCFPTGNGSTTCVEFTEGAEPGESCSEPTDCGNDQLCVQTGEMGSGEEVCAAKCTRDGQVPCDSGDCQAVDGVDHGICPPPSG